MARIKRFTAAQRVFHLLLMLSFLTQAATGMARLYVETNWGRFLASIFGGYNNTLTVHWWVGIFMLALLGVHIIYILIHIDWRRFPKSIYGPDSLLPRKEDLFQALQHIGWILGIKEAPRFDRWGYWEKFDYMAVLLWVHRIEAILAIAHITTIHFFIGHLRRHTFPMDLAMFEGSVDLEKARHERPAWVERMEQNSNLHTCLAGGAPKVLRMVYYAYGFIIILCFLYLFVNGLANARGLLG
jgi:cytochrome b subunit of formate dehydrogenase